MVPKWSQNIPKLVPVIDLGEININSEFEPCSSLNSRDKLSVQFLATMEEVAPLANDPIMLGRPIWSFRDLEHQNPASNSLDNFLVLFLATREAVAPLANDLIMLGTSIQLFRHLEHQFHLQKAEMIS